LKVEIDRIERHHGGQQRRAGIAAADEIALRHQLASDASVYRRQDAREFDVELGALERAFGRDDGSLRGLHGLAALVDHLLRYRLGAPEFHRAFEVAAREGELGLRRLQPSPVPPQPPPRRVADR
jgi:hypothetical protein